MVDVDKNPLIEFVSVFIGPPFNLFYSVVDKVITILFLYVLFELLISFGNTTSKVAVYKSKVFVASAIEASAGV